MVTVCVSVVIALLFQLNTFELINRLSVDDELRNRVVAEAIERSKAGQPETKPVNSGQATSIKEIIKQSGADQLEEFGLISFPQSVKQWTGRWSIDALPLQLLGIILSAALLSLGAPFWYSLMSNLVKLRSVIAGKDDMERAERQTGPSSTTAQALPPAYRGGEAGDLAATG
jgi:hypothetical protein